MAKQKYEMNWFITVCEYKVQYRCQKKTIGFVVKSSLLASISITYCEIPDVNTRFIAVKISSEIGSTLQADRRTDGQTT